MADYSNTNLDFMEFLKKNGLLILICIAIGALIMDYYNFKKAKDKNYSKIAGFFKYTAKNLL